MFRILTAIRSTTYLVSMPPEAGRTFSDVIRQGILQEDLRGRLLELGMSREETESLGGVRQRICWFIHTGRTLRELTDGQMSCDVRGLLRMTEGDDRAVRGYGLVGPKTLKSVAALFDSLEQLQPDGSIAVRDPTEQRTVGHLRSDDPFIIFILSEDAYEGDVDDSVRRPPPCN